MGASPQLTGKLVTNMFEEGKSKTQIESLLIEQGHEARFVKELVMETAKLYATRKRASGLIYVLAGAVLCFTSFLLTITSSFSQGSFPYVLYGLTTAGIIIVFWGFTKIF